MITVGCLRQIIARLGPKISDAVHERLEAIYTDLSGHADDKAPIDPDRLYAIIALLKPDASIVEQAPWHRYGSFIGLLAERLALRPNDFKDEDEKLMEESYRELYRSVPRAFLREVIYSWLESATPLSSEEPGDAADRIQYQRAVELDRAGLLIECMRSVEAGVKLLGRHIQGFCDSFEKLCALLSAANHVDIDSRKILLRAIGNNTLVGHINTPERLTAVVALCPLIAISDYIPNELFIEYVRAHPDYAWLAFILGLGLQDLNPAEFLPQIKGYATLLSCAALLRCIQTRLPEALDRLLAVFTEFPNFYRDTFLPILVAGCAKNLDGLRLLMNHNDVDEKTWAKQAIVVAMSTHTSAECFREIIRANVTWFYGVHESMPDEVLFDHIRYQVGCQESDLPLTAELQVAYAQEIRGALNELRRSPVVSFVTPPLITPEAIREGCEQLFSFPETVSDDERGLRLHQIRVQLVSALVNRMIPLDARVLHLEFRNSGQMTTFRRFIGDESARRQYGALVTTLDETFRLADRAAGGGRVAGGAGMWAPPRAGGGPHSRSFLEAQRAIASLVPRRFPRGSA